MQATFDILKKVIISDDLKEKQMKFIKEHAEKFENTDENKHEWHQLHSEYITLMDKLIEEGCKKENQTIDLEAVKQAFEADPRSMRDSHLVETLFSIIDFPKFKKLMVAHRSDSQTILTDSKLSMMGDFVTFRNDVLADAELLVELDSGDIWKEIAHNNDRYAWETTDVAAFQSKMKVMKHLDKLMKMQMLMKEVNHSKLVPMIKDFVTFQSKMQAKNPDQICEVLKIKEFDAQSSLIYSRVNLPMMSSREFVLFNTWTEKLIDGKKALTSVAVSVDYPKKDVYPGAIRAEIFKLSQIIEEKEGTLVRSISWYDMKGWFPSYLAGYLASLGVTRQMDKIEAQYKELTQD